MKYTTSAEIMEAAKGRPLCQWPGDKLTAVQVDALLGNMPGDLIINEGTRERVIKSLNDIQAIEDQPAPTRLPIDRPVRIKDVEPGDILLYCGVVDDHESWPVIGSEVVVTGNRYMGPGITYSCTTKQGTKVDNQGAPSHCVAQGFSFVRRPFKVGDVVAYADQSKAFHGFAGNLLVQRNEVDHPPGYGIWVITADGKTGSIDKSLLKRAKRNADNARSQLCQVDGGVNGWQRS